MSKTTNSKVGESDGEPVSYFCEHVNHEGTSCPNEAKQTRRYSARIVWNLCHGHALEHDTETSKGRNPNYGLGV